jgi:hypothetical protein
MFNLAAGPGDPYDTFDLVTALMLEATAFLATEGVEYAPGIHLLPKEVQDQGGASLPRRGLTAGIPAARFMDPRQAGPACPSGTVAR